MSLLFDAPLIAGLRYQEDVLTAPQEADLIRRLGTLDLSPFKFQGWLGNRKTRTFGWRYDFDDSSFAPAEPIPAWLDGPREQAAKFAGLAADDFIHVLLARYDPGAGIGWHRDRDVFEDVVGFSLGTPAVLRFRQRSEAGFRRVNIDLPPRSIYLLSGEARHEWEHRIVPGDRLRFSITFRTLSEKGRRVVSRTGG
jgi:alkylated DNA repair protein (DNA oxidative demethylase)